MPGYVLNIDKFVIFFHCKGKIQVFLVVAIRVVRQASLLTILGRVSYCVEDQMIKINKNKCKAPIMHKTILPWYYLTARLFLICKVHC